MQNLKLKFAILERFPYQADFAATVNAHESKVSAVLRGRRKLTKEEASTWREVLQCDPEALSSVIENE